MTEEELYDKIERYLFKQLPEKERKEFEEAIANDPSLAEEVEMHRFEHEAMEIIIAQDTKKKLQNWSQPNLEASLSENQDPPKDNRNWFLIAALIVIPLLFLLIFFLQKEDNSSELAPQEPSQKVEEQNQLQNNPPPTIQEENKEEPNISEPTEKKRPAIADTEPKETIAPTKDYIAMASELYAESAYTLRTARSKSGQEVDSLIQLVEGAYRDKKFEQVISLLKESDPQNLANQIILGHSYMQLVPPDFVAAEAAFNNIMESNNLALIDNNEYYFLLTLLGQGKQNSSIFNQRVETILSDEDHPAYAQVVQLTASIAK